MNFSHLLGLPTSRFLSYAWNLGSLLGGCIILQILSGLLLTLYYSSDASGAFDSVQYICREVNFGWLVRLFHFNNASFVFLILFFHILKGLLVVSYRLFFVWLTGFILMFLMIGVAFTGYVLVWSQISYWAAVVITSLLSTFPLVGESFLFWVLGGYSVGGFTLKLFFTLHFLLPFLILVIGVFHLLALHNTGSSSFMGYLGSSINIPFSPYYVVKDLLGLLPYCLFCFFLLSFPYYLGDPEMFECANPLVSPLHIVPEWYFLAYYAILRSVPSKGWGAFLLLNSILIMGYSAIFGGYFSPFYLWTRFFGLSFSINFFFLSWVGQCPVELPYLLIGQFSLVAHFVLFYIILLSSTGLSCFLFSVGLGEYCFFFTFRFFFLFLFSWLNMKFFLVI